MTKILVDSELLERVIIPALEKGSMYAEQTLSGYGFYRPENPNNFTPDPESSTEQEIANHKAACEAYNNGTYIPDDSDGLVTPEIHVTKAPWGIGSYSDNDDEIDSAVKQLRTALSAPQQEAGAKGVCNVCGGSCERFFCDTYQDRNDWNAHPTQSVPELVFTEEELDNIHRVLFDNCGPATANIVRKALYAAPKAPTADDRKDAERFFPPEFEVWQGDEMVASASGPRDTALSEAMHYAAQYEQDGQVRVFEVTRVLVPAMKGEKE